ncbi:hypothetical protein FDECE_17586 [Fusarium decemcellulare]|nr:hypothetical protein FDECE_17586 [Fusarium decemcellulare]
MLGISIAADLVTDGHHAVGSHLHRPGGKARLQPMSFKVALLLPVPVLPCPALSCPVPYCQAHLHSAAGVKPGPRRLVQNNIQLDGTNGPWAARLWVDVTYPDMRWISRDGDFRVFFMRVVSSTGTKRQLQPYGTDDLGRGPTCFAAGTHGPRVRPLAGALHSTCMLGPSSTSLGPKGGTDTSDGSRASFGRILAPLQFSLAPDWQLARARAASLSRAAKSRRSKLRRPPRRSSSGAPSKESTSGDDKFQSLILAKPLFHFSRVYEPYVCGNSPAQKESSPSSMPLSRPASKSISLSKPGRLHEGEHHIGPQPGGDCSGIAKSCYTPRDSAAR